MARAMMDVLFSTCSPLRLTVLMGFVMWRPRFFWPRHSRFISAKHGARLMDGDNDTPSICHYFSALMLLEITLLELPQQFLRCSEMYYVLYQAGYLMAVHITDRLQYISIFSLIYLFNYIANCADFVFLFKI